MNRQFHAADRQRQWTGTPGWVQAMAAMVALLVVSGATLAAALIDDATLVGGESTPSSREFQVEQAGLYELRLVDVGIPMPLNSVQAAITRGASRVAVLQTAGLVQFEATPGSYEVQVAVRPSSVTGVGVFSARIVGIGNGTTLLDYSDTVTSQRPAPPAGQTISQARVTVPASGAHRITVTDLSFPEALSSVDLLLTRGGTQVARLDMADPEAEFVATPGEYDLLVVAQAGAATSAGLLGVRVISIAGGTPIYDQAHATGELDAAQPVTLPATGDYTLGVADLEFPVALQSVAAAVVRGSQVLARRAGTGSVGFSAAAGGAELYALPLPAPPATVGAMSIDLAQGAARIRYNVVTVSPPASSDGSSSFVARFDVPAAGNHRTILTDFGFPGALADVGIVLLQDGAELGRGAAAGAFAASLSVGPAYVLVTATPGATGSGLLGVEIATLPATASGAGSVVFETTQAAGSGFERRVVDVATAGSYDVGLSDLGFPVAFDELALAVTHGTREVGFAYGGGTFAFDAVPGRYYLNLLMRVDTAAQFGAYGVRVESTAPPPTTELAVSAASVQSGGSVTLTWNSTGATGCVASGQWSGNKATSGTQTVGPLTTNSSFTLTCSGAGGSAEQTVTVSLHGDNSGGGGGAIDLAALFGLLGLGMIRGMLRRRMPQAR